MPESLFAHIGELLRRVVARHGQVISGWTQVLPNGQHIRPHGGQVAVDLQQLVHFFSQANHHPGFGVMRGSTILAYSSSRSVRS